jgi:hypothetical protein
MIVYAAGPLVVCGPGEVKVLDAQSLGDKWCFVCRKRVEFTKTVKADAQPSYYDPWVTITCPRGHQDGDLFPGWTREWGDE